MKIKVGDILQTEYGLVHVAKQYAPSHFGGILLDGNMMGKWIYLRGAPLKSAKVLSK